VSHAQATSGKFNEEVALHVVKETSAGIIVKGARLLATLGPLSDEIEVFPSTLLRADDSNIPFAFAFAIPIATPGLKMICRDSYDHGKSHFDAPLSSRYEEMDAVVIFDNVLVPWERVFMYGEPHLCNQAFAQTNAVVHMAHQVACGKLAKAGVHGRRHVRHCQGNGPRQGFGHEGHDCRSHVDGRNRARPALFGGATGP
jgi:4-hydroxyphenylacetate 3-monooxygenase